MRVPDLRCDEGKLIMCHKFEVIAMTVMSYCPVIISNL